jgi:hypothetical protein
MISSSAASTTSRFEAVFAAPKFVFISLKAGGLGLNVSGAHLGFTAVLYFTRHLSNNKLTDQSAIIHTDS